MKNFLVICFLFIGLTSYGQLDTVDIGTAANDGTGDPLRTAFIKINAAIASVNGINDELIDTAVLETIVPLLSDSAVVIPFLMGSGQTGDTALFNDGALCGSFYNYKDTLVAVYFNGVMSAGTGTETMTIDIKWHATFQDGSAVELNSTPLTITSLTTGTTDVSFNNSIIPPGVRVWGVASGFSAGNRPSYFEGTLVCYKLNRSY